ncbi:Cutinase [Pseudozyma hubeiensis]|nr:Cutinase [Pseudozyma hubeiensis]
MPNGSPHNGQQHNTTSIAPSSLATPSFLTTLDRIRTTLARTWHSETLLRDDAWPTILKRIHTALDTGKPITGAGPNRGLPMGVVVQTLKASWHVDGTWPIGPNAMALLEEQSVERMKAEKGPEAKQDPGPEAVARMYRERGVVVEEPLAVGDDDW